MPIKTFISIVLICWSAYSAGASPAPEKKEKPAEAGSVLYDQRQEGEWNVRAHLDNFLIMIIPTQSAAAVASPNILDFLSKSLPKGSQLKRIKHVKKQQASDPTLETQHFIESKTAPYHVDLTKPDADIKPTPAEDIAFTNSPIKVVNAEPALNPISKRNARRAKHYVLTIPSDEEYILTTRNVEPKSAIRKHKKTIKEKPKRAELKLLGAENEQCGPGMVRDSYGVCTFLKRYKK